MSVLFEEPPVTPTSSLTLRNMQLGDSDRLNLNTRFGMSMDDTFYSYVTSPNTRTKLWQFIGLKQAEIDALLVFMSATAGKIVKVTDDNAEVFQGHILTEPFEISELAREICDRHDVTIEFEGFSEDDLGLLTQGVDFLVTQGGDPLVLETLT